MSISFSLKQIDKLKREATLLGRAQNLTHSAALDRIATTHGFQNWSLLMKHSAPAAPSPAIAAAVAPVTPQPPALQPIRVLARGERPGFRYTRSDAELQLALRKVPLPVAGRVSRTEMAAAQVSDISRQFVSALNAVEFALAYLDRLLALPRFRIQPESPAMVEMRRWLPYHLELLDSGEPGCQILVNREYKPVGRINKKELVDYRDFGHLHIHLSADARQRASYNRLSPGYLYDDGSQPWRSRQDAEAYRRRLMHLRSMLQP